MAFMGIFVSMIVLYLIVVGVLFFCAVTFLIISIIMKHRYRKKLAKVPEGGKKPKKWYLVPRVLSILNFIPLAYFAISSTVGSLFDVLITPFLLSFNAFKGGLHT